MNSDVSEWQATRCSLLARLEVLQVARCVLLVLARLEVLLPEWIVTSVSGRRQSARFYLRLEGHGQNEVNVWVCVKSCDECTVLSLTLQV